MKKITIITFTIVMSLLVANCTKEGTTTELKTENELQQLIETTELADNVLFIYGFDATTIHYEIKDGWEAAWSSDELLAKSFDEAGDELCSGSGFSFRKCVKKHVDAGKCVTVF